MPDQEPSGPPPSPSPSDFPRDPQAPQSIPYQRPPKYNLPTLILPLIPIALALGIAFAIRQHRAGAPTAPGVKEGAGSHTIKADSLAPDFSLPDAHAKETDEPVTLSILVNRGPVLLVFYLGYSCPRCVTHLKEIDDRLAEFNKAGVQVLAISPDTPTETRDSISVFGDLQFPLLSDEDKKVARVYGLMQPDGGMEHGVFLVDRDRHVRFADVSDHPFSDIDALLAAADKLRKDVPVKSK